MKRTKINNKGCPHCNVYLDNPKKGMQCHAHKMEYTIRKDTLDGRPCYVAPVVLMKEGVHHGSGGPIFYSADELSKFTEAWNGRPLPVYHPADDEGMITANSPETIQTQSVGHLYNVVWDEKESALKGEIWVETEKAAKISDVILAMLENGDPIEVSTGLYAEAKEGEGVWNGEQYVMEAINIRPDHLALLPGEKGACSWEDGCGVRNAKQVINNMTSNGAADYRTVMDAVGKALGGTLSKGEYVWVMQINDVEVVYQVEKNEEPDKYYRRAYTYDMTANTVTFNGNPVEVEKRVLFVDKVVSNEQVVVNKKTIQNRTTGGTKMNKRLMDLVANGTITQEEAEKLEGLGDALIDKVTAQPKTEVKEISVKEALQKHFANSGDFMELLPADIKQSVQHGMKMFNSRQAELKGIIISNSKFTEEMLKGKSIDELEAIAELAKPADYSLNGDNGRRIANNQTAPEDVLLPMGV